MTIKLDDDIGVLQPTSETNKKSSLKLDDDIGVFEFGGGETKGSGATGGWALPEEKKTYLEASEEITGFEKITDSVLDFAQKRGIIPSVNIFETLGLKQTREQDIARSQNIYQVSKELGIPLSDVRKNYDDIMEKEYGMITPIKQNEKQMELMIAGGALVGLGTAPASFIYGIGKYIATSEVLKRTAFPAIEAVRKTVAGEPYKYKKAGLKEATGAETAGAQMGADIIELLLTGAVMKGAERAIVRPILKKTFNLGFEKLIKAGWINPKKSGEIKISPENFNKLVKGTPIEKAISEYIKVKNLKLPKKFGVEADVTTPKPKTPLKITDKALKVPVKEPVKPIIKAPETVQEKPAEFEKEVLTQKPETEVTNGSQKTKQAEVVADIKTVRPTTVHKKPLSKIAKEEKARETKIEPPKPPEYIEDFDNLHDDSKQAVNSYERQKDIWFGKKDTRILRTQIETRLLQKEIKSSLSKKVYDVESKEYDKAIQIYLDSKRNPEHLKKYRGKLTAEQQKTVDLSQNLPDNIKAIADKIDQSYKELGLEALEADVIKNVLDNYAGRIWDIPKKQTTAFFRKFGVKTSHAKQRKFGTIVEGWASRYKLKVESATNNLEILKTEIIKTIEDKNFLKQLQKIKTIEGQPLVSNKKLEGYERIEHSNFKVWKHIGKATEEDLKIYSKNTFVDDKGNLFQKQELYAPKEQSKNLNNILGVSKLKDLPGVHTITKYNAIAKAWILQSSFFHHLAFLRSYWFGTNHKTWGEMSPLQAYKQGIKAMEESSPIVMLGVKNGLTLGIRQDWSEELLQEKTAIGVLLDKWKVSKVVKDKILDLRQKQADFLFGEYGAGLKSKAFMIEYRNLTKKYPNMNIDDVAKMAANLINDDFGGLHLQRLGRNPTVQHIFRLFMLAPDWTESNVRTMIKSFRSGTKEETKMYRKFWAGIFTKGVLLTVLANLLLNREDFLKTYKRAWEQGGLKWLDVDVTNIYKATGGKAKNRKYFSIIGHFKDPLKFITHPIRSAQHKGSVVYRFFHEALTGVDWAGRRYTTVKEIVGKEPGKRKYKGKTEVWDYGKRGALEYNQLPSFMLSQVKGWQPVQIQNLINWFAGETEGFDAILNSAGIGITTGYKKVKKTQSAYMKKRAARRRR